MIKRIINDIAVELGDLFHKNFETKSFFGKTWVARRREDKGSLLIRTGKLRRSIHREVSNNSIRFTSSEAYAAIHNEGGEIIVTKQMKRFFGAKYYETSGKIRKTKTGELSKTKSNLRISAQAMAWKYMAIMKKGSKIKIPQRQFIGDAPEIKAAVEKIFNEQLKRIELIIKKNLTPKTNK
jgi:phage gpG-like protein